MCCRPPRYTALASHRWPSARPAARKSNALPQRDIDACVPNTGLRVSIEVPPGTADSGGKKTCGATGAATSHSKCRYLSQFRMWHTYSRRDPPPHVESLYRLTGIFRCVRCVLDCCRLSIDTTSTVPALTQRGSTTGRVPILLASTGANNSATSH